jgi:hypothetical protein
MHNRIYNKLIALNHDIRFNDVKNHILISPKRREQIWRRYYELKNKTKTELSFREEGWLRFLSWVVSII